MSRPQHVDSGQSCHQATSYDRLRMTPHFLDWADVSRRSKTYPLPAAAQLIPVEEFPDTSLWRLMENPKACPGKTAMDVRLLSQVLMLAYGFTAKQKTGGQIYRYRSVPSAGALYPAEIYLAWPFRSSAGSLLLRYQWIFTHQFKKRGSFRHPWADHAP